MNKQPSTEQTTQPEETPLFVSLAQERSHQSILIEVLKVALEPNPLKKKLSLILDYLLSLPHLQFGPKAALFFVEQDTETLTLFVSKGFPQPKSVPAMKPSSGSATADRLQKRQNYIFQHPPSPVSISLESHGHLQEITVFPSSRMVNPSEYSLSM